MRDSKLVLIPIVFAMLSLIAATFFVKVPLIDLEGEKDSNDLKETIAGMIQPEENDDELSPVDKVHFGVFYVATESAYTMNAQDFNLEESAAVYTITAKDVTVEGVKKSDGILATYKEMIGVKDGFDFQEEMTSKLGKQIEYVTVKFSKEGYVVDAFLKNGKNVYHDEKSR